MSSHIKLIECPRDAMQGLTAFVPTALKAAYINALLKVGFDTLDFGSFVSEKAIPQLRDTAEVLSMLHLDETDTSLLAIVANIRGVDTAVNFPEISYLGFPFSVSETFQQRNTNANMSSALHTVDELLEKCDKYGKTAVIYLSMGFGNPYGDPWNNGIVEEWAHKLVSRGVKILSVADTTGMSDPAKISTLLPSLIAGFPGTEIGIHLHSTPAESHHKIIAAYRSGCRRFDSALMGFGGCPMAADHLTGNIATEDVLAALAELNAPPAINKDALNEAQQLARQVFLT